MKIIEQPEDRWYSVEEGLPPRKITVQIFVGNHVNFGYYNEYTDKWHPIAHPEEFYADDLVTHWRIRAKPPSCLEGWIRIEDKEPANGQLVFRCDGLQGELPIVSEYQAFKRNWYRYWMPIPKLPKRTRPDCRHYDASVFAEYACAVALPRCHSCEYGADWCQYESKKSDVDKDINYVLSTLSDLSDRLYALDKRVERLEARDV